jgi:hypothetical protein
MTPTNAPSNSPRDLLPDLFMMGLDDPDMTPAALAEGLAEHVDTDMAGIYLDDIRQMSQVLAAYVEVAEPIVQNLADARAKELTLSMPPSWWGVLGQMCEERLGGVGILGTSPEPWEVLDTVAEAIRAQFHQEEKA